MNEFIYLLDTNIISDLIRNPQGHIFEKIKIFGEESICTSIVVAAELRYGIHKKKSDRLTRQVIAILSHIDILSLEAPADEYYSKLRVFLENKGTPIGPNDMLIAAQALALDLTLITANINEFSRIPDLKVDNWLE
jgi:tRNA(fMet)-specific endonuclease VapC